MMETLGIIAAVVGYIATIVGVFAYLGRICDLYAGYHTLGGNHFVDDLYEKMRHWKVVT